jgi:hypothetical protein
VTNDTNVGMLFSSLGVQRKPVWTGIYKRKSLSTFLDIKRYPPITAYVLITELTSERKYLLLLAEEWFSPLLQAFLLAAANLYSLRSSKVTECIDQGWLGGGGRGEVVERRNFCYIHVYY